MSLLRNATSDDIIEESPEIRPDSLEKAKKPFWRRMKIGATISACLRPNTNPLKKKNKTGANPGVLVKLYKWSRLRKAKVKMMEAQAAAEEKAVKAKQRRLCPQVDCSGCCSRMGDSCKGFWRTVFCLDKACCKTNMTCCKPGAWSGCCKPGTMNCCKKSDAVSGTGCCKTGAMSCCKPKSNCCKIDWSCCKINWSRLNCCKSTSWNCCKTTPKPAAPPPPAPPPDRQTEKRPSFAGFPKLDATLVEHTSFMKGAIPVLPLPLAWICLILNVFLPGIGTLTSGLFCLCFGKPRFSINDSAHARMGSFCVNFIVGISQLFTIIFCLVGWGWSVWWGIIMLKVARKSHRLKQVDKNAERVAAAGIAANQDVERAAR